MITSKGTRVHKFRFHSLEKSKLNRPSSGIKVKETIEQLNEENSLKVENQKLKDFIRRQTVLFKSYLDSILRSKQKKLLWE